MIDINGEHPEYKLKRAMSRRYRDLYAGGEQLQNSAPEYLLPRQKEPAEVYNERLRKVFYENYIGSIVDWYAATLFRREPVLAIEGTNTGGREFFSEFIDDCDLKGTNFTDLLRRQFIEALIQGSSYVLVDFPRSSVAAGTRGEEDRLGVSRAYLVPYAAEDLINWSYDERGSFEWVVLRTQSLKKDKIEDADWRTETRWTYYDKQRFRVYQQLGSGEKKGEIALVDSGQHGLAKLNRTPLFRLEIPEGLWLLNRAGSLQLEHFNKSNALSWALEMGLFAMPVVYSDRKWNQMIGESYYIQLGPNDKFGWTEPEGRVYEIATQNLIRLQGEIYRVCYLPQMGGSSDLHSQQSGLSKLRDFSVTQEVLRAYGDSVKDLCRRVLRAVEQVREDGLMVDVSGIDEFDIGDFSVELANAEQLLALGIQSPTLIRQVRKKLAMKYLCDVRQDIKDRIASEIDAAADETRPDNKESFK
jgi:hypothetical protein